jgi:hypothetical protein
MATVELFSNPLHLAAATTATLVIPTLQRQLLLRQHCRLLFQGAISQMLIQRERKIEEFLSALKPQPKNNSLKKFQHFILCTKPEVVYIAAGKQTWLLGDCLFFGTFFLVKFVAFLTNELGFFIITIVNLCNFGKCFLKILTIFFISQK